MHQPGLLGMLVALVLAVGMAQPASASQDPPRLQENALLAAARRAWDKNGDVFAELQALESNALAAAGADVDRQGKKLTLHLKSRATKTYEDRPECESSSEESKCQKYVLVAHAYSRSMFLVANLYYESAEFALIDDVTGDETIVRAFPVFSPSGNHVLALVMDPGDVGCWVQIWRREGHEFVLEWSASPYTNGGIAAYKLFRWAREDTVELQAETSFEWPKPNVTTRFDLRRSADGWKVVEVR
jgi:hypothetical protein